MFLFLKFIKNIEKLSTVRQVLETLLFLALGSFETLGSKLSHGTSKKFADVRTHLRKVLKDKVDQLTVKEAADLLASDGMLIKRPLLVKDGKVVQVGYRKPYADLGL